MADEELRAAVRAFFRSQVGPEWLLEKGEEEFEDAFEQIFEQGVLTRAFREFHDEHRRYPVFEEFPREEGSSIGMLKDMM